jgi:hypothetical protein
MPTPVTSNNADAAAPAAGCAISVMPLDASWRDLPP